jgi:hypothetical protein
LGGRRSRSKTETPADSCGEGVIGDGVRQSKVARVPSAPLDEIGRWVLGEPAELAAAHDPGVVGRRVNPAASRSEPRRPRQFRTIALLAGLDRFPGEELDGLDTRFTPSSPLDHTQGFEGVEIHGI